MSESETITLLQAIEFAINNPETPNAQLEEFLRAYFNTSDIKETPLAE